MTKKYIFIDPFNASTKGVTTYINYASRILDAYEIDHEIIKIGETETINNFINRIESLNYRQDISYIEAPESLATTRLINKHKIHIRLHCSRSLGAIFENKKTLKEDIDAEQKEIIRANIISAPSSAAIYGSRLIFTLPPNIIIYPNPAPLHAHPSRETSKKYDFVFLGRLQKLKGYDLFIELAKKNNKYNFLLLTSSNYKHISPPKNLTIKNTTDNLHYLKHSRYLLLLSQFETASMVALEALSVNIPVITWSHLGIAEYAKIPHVIPVEFNNFGQIISEFEKYKTVQIETNSSLSEINNSFIKSLIKLLSGETDIPFNNMIKNNNFILDDVFSNIQHIINRRNLVKESTLNRKIKKLKKNPKGFFMDSKYFGWLFEKNKKPVNDLVQKTIQSPNSQNDEKKQNDIHNNKMLCDLDYNASKFEFKVSDSKPIGYVTGVFYPAIQPSWLENYFLEIDKYNDFPYLSKERLFLGMFDIPKTATTFDLIHKIDQSNKKNLNTLANLILINPTPSFCEAIYSSCYSLRVICISINQEELPKPSCVDSILVINEKINVANIKYRRYFQITDINDLPMYTRKLLQEGFPKNPDMFIPVFNFNDFNRELFKNLSNSSYDCYIKLKDKNIIPLGSTATMIYQSMSENIKSLAVKESVYLKYKSIIESSDLNKELDCFIRLALNDGMKFHVE